MWLKVLCTLLVFLFAVQPGYAHWWEDKQLWPTRFEPWQSYIVRQNEWNKDGIYGKKKSFVGKQKEYGTYNHQGAHEAVRLFHKKADFYEVVSFLGYVRSAIAVRMSTTEFKSDDWFVMSDPFGVERCVVSQERELCGGKVFNLLESAFFRKEEIKGLNDWRGLCRKGSFFTSLGGQYEQAAVRLSQSPYRQPFPTFPGFACSLPLRKPAVAVEHEQYGISIPSERNAYTQIVVLNHAIIQRGLANAEEKYGCFGLIFHSEDAVVKSLLAQMSELYSAILNERKPDRNHITKQIATFQWMFAHAMPYARGSAAVGTIFSNALYMYHNMEDAIRPTRVGVVVDIEALSTPLADFLNAYPTFFEGTSA